MWQLTARFISVPESFKEYGKLSHKNLDDLQSGFREIKVTGEEDKEDPTGFRSLEAEKRRRAVLGVSVVPGPSGLAYRVLRDVQEVSGRVRSISMQAERI